LYRYVKAFASGSNLVGMGGTGLPLPSANSVGIDETGLPLPSIHTTELFTERLLTPKAIDANIVATTVTRTATTVSFFIG
jgi:hypothetical protein